MPLFLSIELFKQSRMMRQMDPFKPTDDQKAETDKLIDKWQPLLFLSEWAIAREYCEYPDREIPRSAAEVDADCTYKLATISFYPRFFSMTDVEREHALLHEMLHCVTEIMKGLAYQALVKEKHVMWHTFKEADERCTQQITNIVFELYRQRATIA